MLRKMFIGAVGAVALLAMGVGSAQAITFKLEFQSSGGICTAGSASCTAEVGDTVLLDVIMVMNVNRNANNTSVGFDLSSMGLSNTDVTADTFQFGTTTPSTLNGVVWGGPGSQDNTAAANVVDAECNTALAGCDARYSSFGYIHTVSLGAGMAYTAGTISIDLTGANTGTWTIATYVRTGVNAPGDNTANPHMDAFLTIVPIPEPGTASLLGLGLLGLVMAGRRTRD
jgi:hypothetical protein